MAGQAQVPGGQTTPPNINSLAAQGIQGAGMGTAQGMAYTPLGVTAGQLGTTNLAPYMNPYTTDVIDASQADVLRGANIGLDQLGAQAQMAKAFGGSRHGVAMSEMGRGVGEIMGQQAAGLRQANYAQAQQAAQQDISGRLQADLANQGVDLSGAQHRLGAAGQLGNLSNLGFGMGQTVNQNLQTQGAMQQALQQAVMDASAQKYKEYTGHPAQSLQYLQQALGTGVYSQPNTVTSTKTPGLFDYLTLGASMKAGQPLGNYMTP
tara:strand:+ start:6632 stop:7423 length:792 start_codon:yes stop_codon:yes gene_type:complete